MKWTLTFVFALVLSTSAFAKDLPFTQQDRFESKNDDPYFTISKIEVEPVDTPSEISLLDKGYADQIGSVITIVDKLIALGKKVWPIVEAGKPVVDINMNTPISVLPFRNEVSPDVTFYEMTNWKAPKAKSFKVVYKNGFGSKVISFVYTVIMQGGGQYEGKGSYLTGVQVIASNVSVAWGFDFNALSALINITNSGSSENPVAGASIRIDYTAKTVLKVIQSSELFYVNGNGEIFKY